MRRFKNILVAVDVVDTTPGGDQALSQELKTLLEMVSRLREIEGHAPQVTLVSVLPDGDADEEALSEAAQQALQSRVVPQLRGGEAHCVVRVGVPFVEIIRQVIEGQHDLVVVSAATGEASVVGHVATQLIRKCPCPVWVTPRNAPAIGPKTVLASVALHDQASEVVELAAAVAEMTGGEWHVLHVPEYPLEGGMRLRGTSAEEIQEYERSCREEAWSALHELTDPLADSSGIEPKLWMAEGKPSEKILEAEKQLAAHLLVIGTIGRGGLAGMIIGNTAEHVIAGAETSVLAVKPPDFVCPIEA